MFLNKELSDLIAGRARELRVYKSGPATQGYVAQALLGGGNNVVVVVPGAKELSQAKALLGLFQPEDDAPAWDRAWAFLPPYEPGQGRRGWAERWAALYCLAFKIGPRGLVMTADNLLPLWPAKDVILHRSLELRKGEEISPELILDQVIPWGFERTAMVLEPGQAAMRGDILDIFPPGYDRPLRLEFFGDELEGIRLFDVDSQRSVRDLDGARIIPFSPAVLDQEYKSKAQAYLDRLSRTGEMAKPATHALALEIQTGRGFIWPGLFYPDAARIGAWLPEDPVFVLVGASQLRSRLEEAQWAWQNYFSEQAEKNRWSWPSSLVTIPLEGARKTWLDKRQVLFEDLVMGQKKQGVDLAERTFREFSDLFWRPEQKNRPWHTLVEHLKDWRRTKNQVILSFHSERSRNKFLELAAQEEIKFSREYNPGRKGLFALTSTLSQGMDLAWNHVLILAEDVLQPGGKDSARPRDAKGFKALTSFEGLADGDLLVHRDYGIGRFSGLHRLRIADTPNDYLLLIYANEDKLYLPVDRLNQVARYKGPEGTTPALDRLGGVSWKKSRERAKKAVEKIASELVEMYAYRKVAKGYAYGPVNEMYRDFEVTFGFEETPDQEQAIRDVLKDMEKPRPMDRLVCGDVGFGKTEVALRSAFRAVLDGKQVVLLCPTTVLAEQHYQTFSRRLEPFAVRVAMLSRFVPKARQKAVVEAVKKGMVDILIGTHRLLSKDVSAPNLGLLILDEEQRFGVKHKERLKEMRKNVDVLTLTATPIPRTLQLSLSGIRGLSVIETPPQDRKAVETSLIERDPEMLKNILKRELERKGQVFWVHNRVRGLDETASFVQNLVPEAKVKTAHGQMPERLLEQTMHEFWHKEIDVLVCTAIIESGLDFPRANTLVVDQAHMFGLGQLYQLRGRVGRSERQAYAYFVVPSLADLSETAVRRMRIILEMDYLGAGFQVAIEDLRLRGAGNILGEAQSGNIARVGLDLFLEMLENEVRRIKGEPLREDTDPELTIGFPAHIPETYIGDSGERLRYYKALTSSISPEHRAELAAEIRDRYGPLPEEAENFLAVISLKQLLGRLQASKAELYPGRVVVHWEEGAAVSPETLVKWVQARPSSAGLLPPGKLQLLTDGDRTQAGRIRAAEESLAELAAAGEEHRVHV